MAKNFPFDRTIINTRERPYNSDLHQAQSQAYDALLRTIRAVTVGRAGVSDRGEEAALTNESDTRFFSDGFLVQAAGPGKISIRPGLGLGYGAEAASYKGIGGLDFRSTTAPAVLSKAVSFAVPPTNPGFSRRDIVQVRIGPYLTDPSLRLTYDPIQEDFLQGEYKTVSFDLAERLCVSPQLPKDAQYPALQLKLGTESETPTPPVVGSGGGARAQAGVPAPTVPPVPPPGEDIGFTKIAELLVEGSTVTVIDNRRLLAVGGTMYGALEYYVKTSSPFMAFNSASMPPGFLWSVVPRVEGGVYQGDFVVYFIGPSFSDATFFVMPPNDNSSMVAPTTITYVNQADYLVGGRVDADLQYTLANSGLPAISVPIGAQWVGVKYTTHYIQDSQVAGRDWSGVCANNTPFHIQIAWKV